LKDIHDILKKYWGFDKFRPVQEEIIQAVLQKKDSLALLPTGAGKSVCFQVPALAMEGICIVVTPLIALMKDQVEQLKKRNIQAISIYSGMNSREIDIALDNCVYGKVKFLYLSPERLKTEILQERAKKMKINLLAIDEAHCISQWGYDFRPAYLEIAAFREIIPKNVPILALTATATKLVEKDIQEKLLFNKPLVFKNSFLRNNLSYSCFLEEDKSKRLLKVLNNVKGTSIVYVRNRRLTEEVGKFLIKNKIKACHYHAGLSNEQRNVSQNAWIKNDVRVIVATNAFGMGIDKPDVRAVIHLDLPNSLEAYYQESGRAGRDGIKSYCVILYNHNDLEELLKTNSDAYPSIEFIKKVYQSLANYLKVAAGSSNMSSYDFDIDDFHKVYKLPKKNTFYAIKRLETEGFVQLNESFYNPSKILFIVDNKILYDFQLKHETYDDFIKMLLRMYGGELFSNFIQIAEIALGKNLNISKEEVHKKLLFLQKMDILIYQQQKEKPQLTFTTHRYNAPKLPLNIKALEERKKIDLEKIVAMGNYVRLGKKCRAIFLLEYFGEISSRECGICDICLLKRKYFDILSAYKVYKPLISKELENTEMPIDALIEKIDSKKGKEIIAVIREMLDGALLGYDEKGDLKLI